LPGPESAKNQESEKSPKEIIKAKKEQDEEKQDSTYSIRSTSSHRLFGLPEWIQVPQTKTYQAEFDQKDKMRHAMDDNGIPSKEIHERLS
ncbi:hypothetical protein Tco_0274443, partial [Tanacetum coccineum]